ncbi:MAG: response regulator [Gammaproteobacteria bacterium]|nr:response regulator [Gammaproteobacteria bacterium]
MDGFPEESHADPGAEALVPEEAFTALLHNMVVPACVFDRHSGKLIDANGALAVLLGQPSHKGVIAAPEFWADDRDPARLFERARLEKRLSNFETTIVTRKREVVSVFVRVDRAADFDVVQFQDLRPLQMSTRSAEQLDTASELKFAAIFNNSPVPTALVKHLTHEVVELNPAFVKMVAGERQDVAGKHTGPSWLDGDERARFLSLVEENGRVENFDAELYQPNGRVLAVSINCQLVEIAGVPLRLVQFVVLDERRAFEEKMRNAQRRLEEAQAIAKVGDFAFDLETNTLSGSPQLCELMDVPAGVELSIETALGLIDSKDLEAISRRVMADIEQSGFVWEYRVPLADSKPRHHRLVARVERAADGRQPVIYGTVQDVTDQREAEAERLAFEKQVQEAQKLESLGVLSGGVAHDFNNLLAGVMGNAELALMENLPEAARNYIEDVRTASRRAAELTRQLLAYSGRARTVFESVNLGGLAGEMAQLLKLSVTDNCQLQVFTASDEHFIEADAAQVRQVLMNLIINASEAIDHQRGEVTLRIGEIDCLESFFAELVGGEELPAGRYVYVEVVDNGAGMDAETSSRMFEPFYTTKFAGRGLGLAAVMGILRSHGAAIRVESEPGAGTRIVAYFPASGSTSALRSPRIENADTQRKGLILVVDDEPAVRDLLQSVLVKFGFDALVAEGGEQGIRLFDQHAGEVSLVLLDMSMPGMDGVETLQRLRERDPAVSVLVMSGYSEEDTMNRFRELGVEGFIAKPFPVGDVVQRVHALLGDQPIRR